MDVSNGRAFNGIHSMEAKLDKIQFIRCMILLDKILYRSEYQAQILLAYFYARTQTKRKRGNALNAGILD